MDTHSASKGNASLPKTFPERHEEIIRKAPRHPLVRLWAYSLLFSVLITVLCGAYVRMYFHTFSTRVLNETFADAGLIIIGCSFALSGICYFWNFLDTKIVYRKYLGLIGFFLIVLHVLLSLFFVPFPITDYFTPAHRTAFTAALISLVIFVCMAFISNRYAVHQLGGAHWRILLRTGYAAYFLALIHFALRKGPEWDRWLAHHTSILPPLSMIVVVLGCAVLALRFALFLALSQKKA